MANFFQTSCETRELHSDADLRTRSYRNSFVQAKAAIEEVGKIIGFEIRGFDQTYGEIDCIGNGYEAIITALQMSPIETHINIKLNVFSVFGFGRPKKLCVRIYSELDKRLKNRGR